MKKQLEQVFEFNKLGGQNVSDTPRWINVNHFDLQYGLILEELSELSEAYDKKDGVEVLDALVDIQYVLLGMVNRLGLSKEFVEAFETVHINNMTKVKDSEGNIIVKFREDGKILKPEGYKKVDLESYFGYLNEM